MVVEDLYSSNTALYADASLAEGVDYARRYKRHPAFDDELAARSDFGRTAVLAVHGGGIEPGTSELCLAAAGYHPASLAVTPAGGPTFDYWMFEGLRSNNNDDLHVTATHCDDWIAASLCAGARNVVSLHGTSTQAAGLPNNTELVLVGGRNAALRSALVTAFQNPDPGMVAIPATDAANHPTLSGTDPTNIANRTLTGTGAQLEITTPVRNQMFTENTRARRKHTTTTVFWSFVAAVRKAVAQIESGQPIP